MKVHIENLNITVANQEPPAGLIAALAIAAAKSDANDGVPTIGEKWPGTEAIYAGVSLSRTDDSFVHLIVWPGAPEVGMGYEDAIKFANGVNPDMGSHLPTRHQSITLFERLQDLFAQDPYYWTLTKTKSGETAFIQCFNYGYQGHDNLSGECRVRAVSEIPLAL